MIYTECKNRVTASGTIVAIVALICLALFSGCSVIKQSTSAQQRRAQVLIADGVLALRAGLLADAQAHFSMSDSLDESAAAKDGLGCVELMKGNVSEAQELFEASLAIDESYTTALGHLALVYEIRNNTAKAEALYQEALRGEPEDFRNRNNYAALIVKENEERARAELYRARAVSRHPVIEENIQRLEEK